MPAQEVQQPQAQQMEMTAQAPSANAEQPRPAQQMAAEPMSMRGGDKGGCCLGLCAGLACFECLECCC